MIKTYFDYLESKTIQKVTFLEKENIKEFLEFTYKDDLKTSISIKDNHFRYSIISGYYAMHDISKLYLLEKFNIKFTKPSVHDAVIKALKKLVKKNEIINYIEKSNKEFSKIQKLDYFLMKGKLSREKTQYYTNNNFNFEKLKEDSNNFIENIVKPYIKIVEKLIEEEKNDN